METKKCKNCGKVKNLDEFPNEKRGKFGKGGRCTICKRAKTNLWKQENPNKSWNKLHPERAKDGYLRKTYNITLQQYNELKEKQKNNCLICGSDYIGTLHVDHDHSCCPGKLSCGKCIRGLICSKCNNGLGCFNDNLSLLEQATLYLKGANVNTINNTK